MDVLPSSFLSRLLPSQTILSITKPSHTKLLLKISSHQPLNKQIPSSYPPKTTLKTPLTRKKPSPPSGKPSQPSEKPSRPPPLMTVLFNAIDDFINTFIDPPTRSSVDPRHVLSSNFAPVDELPPTPCTVVEGALPPCLDGVYIRNGPNPQHLPRGPYHLFDGDGMLHSVRISRGKATLCSRFVKTYKYMVERDMGSPVIPSIFSSFNGLIACASRGSLTVARRITGQYDPANGIGLANTSIAFFGRKVFALCESDLPYEVKLAPNGDIITLGRHDFAGKLIMSMTAHPKIDPDTGECFAFKYGPFRPFLSFFRFTPDGEKMPDVPIFSMKRPTFLHDFAITKKYAIFNEIQIGMNPIQMIFGGSLVSYDPGKIPRIGVIPRYAKDDTTMRWFEVPGLNVVHAINAWDEDDGDIIAMVAPNILPIEHALERVESVHSSMEMVRIDLRTGKVWRHPISTRNLDFAVINPAYVAKKNRYVYAAVGDPMPKLTGVVKVDLSVPEGDRIVASRMYGPGCYGGEPFFVARESQNVSAGEDDGYVMSYVHNENTGESRFLIMDAKSPNLETVAAIKLPQRVPYGFHGLFIRESDLNKLGDWQD